MPQDERLSNHGIPFRYIGKDIDDIPDGWRKEFEREIAENNFLRGGKHILLIGNNANDQLGLWGQCLVIAGYPVYSASVYELQRRVDSLAILWDSETRQRQFDNAECIIIRDYFWGELERDQQQRTARFLQEAIDEGVTLLLASDKVDPYLEQNGEDAAAIIEQEFEVIRVQETKKKKPKRKT